MSQVRKDILNGWKEIATYVGRDIRTVERWEKQRGLPIRRVPGEGRATVYAVMTELDLWFANVDSSPVQVKQDDDIALPVEQAHADTHRNGEGHPEKKPTLPIDSVNTSVLAPLPDELKANYRLLWKTVIAFSSVVFVVGLVAWLAVSHKASQTSALNAVAVDNAVNGSIRYGTDTARGTPGVPYPSRVNGVDEIYLRGVYFYEQRRPEALKRAIDCFSQAIAKDPNYAPAFAGLSSTFLLQREYSELPDNVAYSKAREAAERAVSLDPKLPQPHVSMGFIDFFWAADAVSAEHEFRRAIALEPSLVSAHHWYGSVLTQEGRYPEAMEQLNLAQRLDPTSTSILSVRALAIGVSGQRKEAVDMLQELLNGVPEAPSPHQMLAILSLVEPHDISRWLAESRRVATMRNDKALHEQLNIAEPTYRNGGEKAMWTALLAYEQSLHPAQDQPTYTMGVYQALLGNDDAAFPILIANARRHDPGSIVMNMDPRLARLRSDPRYEQMFAETHIADAMKLR